MLFTTYCIGNIHINLLLAPYCLKHPVSLHLDGTDPMKPSAVAGTPTDMYMGVWALYSPQDSLFDNKNEECKGGV